MYFVRLFRLYLPSQIVDVNHDRRRVAVAVLSPYIEIDLFRRIESARIDHREEQDLKLQLGQLDRLPFPLDDMGGSIERRPLALVTTSNSQIAAVRTGPSQVRLDPRDEHVFVEGLCKVVVRSHHALSLRARPS